MAAGVRQGQLLLLLVLVCFSTQIAAQEQQALMCSQFKRCFTMSPVCVFLFYYYKCTEDLITRKNDPPCGESSKTGSASRYAMPRIVGGIDAEEREFPWTVYLEETVTLRLCAGSIIDRRHVVTAAHCVRSLADNPQRLTVGYGSIKRTSLVNITAERIDTHPLYNITNKDNDIAIVRLSKDLPLTASTNLRSVCLPEPSTSYSTGSGCLITGWGTQLDGGFTFPDILQKAYVPLVPLDLCQRSYADNDYILVSNRQLCAGYYRDGGVDACKGDSGGPLFCPEGDKWVLYGVVSVAEGCAKPGFPGVYAFVPQHVEWINSIRV
ncbi:trypsin-1-like [Haliotis rufescens]|uniref:trypsin-1-like n=1 Tax=Haliotis rufescens TaxID=6454 RepID=UPI00201EBF83|nr:trypsin-1-like [Haliotis rufescens]